MKSLSLIFLMFVANLVFAGDDLEPKSFKLGVEESGRVEVIDLGPDKREPAFKFNGFTFSPLKIGAQVETNLVNHTGSALVLGADASYLWNGLGAGLGCTLVYGTSANGIEEGRALNRVRNDKNCFFQVFLVESTGGRLGLRIGKGRTDFRNVDGFNADHTTYGLFTKSNRYGVEGEFIYYRVDIPEEFRSEYDQDFNGNFLIRITKDLF